MPNRTRHNRLHWLLTVLVGIVALTVYAASDDLALSLLLAVAIGWSALAATLLLLVQRREGYAVAAISAAGLLAYELIDVRAMGFGWLQGFFVTLAVAVLVLWVGLARHWYQPPLRSHVRRWAAGKVRR
jgi:hypothetical protein